jgi:uncharacterized iron-regulated membrane protein
MSIRPAILVAHRWLTFVVGAFFVLVTLTGAVLVFAPQLDHALNPRLFAATPGDVGIDSAIAAMRAAQPDRRITRVWLPVGERPVYVGEFARRRPLQIHVDPGTGRVLGIRGEGALALLRRLHINLLVPLGGRVVGIVGILLLLMSVTGLWLWWPGLRKLPLGFRLRRGSGSEIVCYDLHNIGGIVSLPVVAITALTGAMLAFTGATQVVAHALVGRAAPPIERPEGLRSTPRPGATRRPASEFLRIARAATPEYSPMLVTVPANDRATVQVRMWHRAISAPDGVARVTMDQWSGKVLLVTGPAAMTGPQRFLHRWVYPLHIGVVGGAATRWLWLVLGIIPTALAGTGLYVWWSRRRKRAVLEERRARAA